MDLSKLEVEYGLAFIDGQCVGRITSDGYLVATDGTWFDSERNRIVPIIDPLLRNAQFGFLPVDQQREHKPLSKKYGRKPQVICVATSTCSSPPDFPFPVTHNVEVVVGIFSRRMT
jgi:hypothetical protein